MTSKNSQKKHGLTTLNKRRPKSTLRKRNNKHKSVAQKMKVIIERRLSAMTRKGKTPKKVKVAPAAKSPKSPVAKKPVVKKTSTKKTSAPKAKK